MSPATEKIISAARGLAESADNYFAWTRLAEGVAALRLEESAADAALLAGGPAPDAAQKELSSIHRWIERNHADGFIDSLTYLQNLERVTDSWHDRLDRIEMDARRFVRERDEAREALMKIEEVFIDGDDTYADREKMGSIAVSALAARGLIRSLPQAALDENKMSDMDIKLAQQETITGEGLE